MGIRTGPLSIYPQVIEVQPCDVCVYLFRMSILAVRTGSGRVEFIDKRFGQHGICDGVDIWCNGENMRLNRKHSPRMLSYASLRTS